MNRMVVVLLGVLGGGAALWLAAPHVPALLDTFTESETSSAAGDRPVAAGGSREPKAGPQDQAEAGSTVAEPSPTAEGGGAEPESAPGVVPPVTLGEGDHKEAGDGDPAASLESDPAGTGQPGDTTSASPFAAGVESVREKLSSLVGDEPEAPSAGEESGSGTVAPSEADPDQIEQSEAAPAGGGSQNEPTFDIVRIGPDGRSVIAGRAEPGAEVEIRVGERVIDRVVAGRRGHWVATPAEPLEPGDRELSLMAYKGGIATPSAGAVLIAFAEPPPPQPPPSVVAEPPPPQPPEEAVAEAPSDSPMATAEEQAIAVLMREDGGVGRVLQAPGRVSSGGELALMVVDYDARGKVQLSGEAPPGAPVRVYVDNQPAAEVIAREDGTWRTVLEQPLAPGDYTLRLDQVGPSGEPVARLETPFTRAGRPAAVEDGERVDYVIVQPGNSLWRISRRLFGSGFHHVEIYETNKGQIRDPDLIYPGQVFTVPTSLSDAS